MKPAAADVGIERARIQTVSVAPTTRPSHDSLVMIVEDSDLDRQLLERFVRKEGWSTISAENGEQAIALFQSRQPDIVLMDALMPVMDGMEATRRIKSLAGERMVPIVFLTSLQETQELVRCLQAGGDDFLSKPYNKVILGAKLSKYERMRSMHSQLLKEREKVAQINGHLLREQAVAKAVFDNVIRLGSLTSAMIKHHLSPLAIFNGDVLLATRTPDGGLAVFLGDFTGHGLPAAIGAMPTAEIFYGMCAKGFDVGDVVQEINRKLKRVLPVGVFCCASMVHLNFNRQEVRVWHGGVPEAMIFRPGVGIIETISSRHLPLGVMPHERFDDSVVTYTMQAGDRLYLCSDGVLEARNGAGDMLGDERYRALFAAESETASLFEKVRDGVYDFMAEGEREDDFTFAEVMMMNAADLAPTELSRDDLDAAGPRNFALAYELRGDSLRRFNPLPLLQHIMLDVPGLRGQTSGLYTVLSEMYANALDHGVLGLESKLKDGTHGFASYFEERSRRLASIASDARVEFSFEHTLEAHGGCLTIAVTDSGCGFDHQALRSSLEGGKALAGRGIALLKHFCESVRYTGSGNRVEVLYRWSH